MQLPIRSFSQLMQDMSAVLQSSVIKLLDLSPGSVLRSILEANASVALWIQFLITQMLETTRAATCSADDLDSWVQDFGLSRLPASQAVGTVVFSRYVATNIVTIPAGVRVKSSDGSLTFEVVADTTNRDWSNAESAYVLPIGIDQLAVPISALTLGPSGNVQAGMITLLASSIVGIDEVSNPYSLVGGIEAESDESLRSRFLVYVNSRSRATADAIGFAVSSVRQGLSFVVHENVDAAGHPQLGTFVVTVDDGSGTPPSPLLALIAQAVDAVRPIGARFSVRPPSVQPVDITVHVDLIAGVQLSEIRVELVYAIERFVNGLPVGAGLSVTRVAQIIYQASAKVGNVSSITLNGLNHDLVVSDRGIVKAGLIAII